MTKSTNKILIVEDERDLSDVYSLILQRAGFDTQVATNGQLGLEKLKQWHPKLILLDIFMPIMDGRAFLENIDLSDIPDTKVVVCSNTADQKLMDEMQRLGADRVVTKASLAPSDLLNLVTPYMSQ